MLKLYDETKTAITELPNIYDYYIEEAINTLPTLHFKYGLDNSDVDSIREEGYVRAPYLFDDSNDWFVIKEVRKDFNELDVMCVLDHSQFNYTHFYKLNFGTSYETVTKTRKDKKGHTHTKKVKVKVDTKKTCDDALDLIIDKSSLDTAGWLYVDSRSDKKQAKKRVFKVTKCTPWTAFLRTVKIWNYEWLINNDDKAIYLYDKVGGDKGAYFIEELNLTNLEVDKNSNGVITRLYPYGKTLNKVIKGDKVSCTITVNGAIKASTGDTITTADAAVDSSGNKVKTKYLENRNTINKKILAHKTWSDIDDSQDLYDEALDYLEEHCKPTIAYTASVTDLSNNSEYSALSYSIGDTVHLTSKTTGVRGTFRIVQLVRYPLEPSKNTCTLANKKTNLVNYLKSAEAASSVINEVVGSDTTTNGVVIEEGSINSNGIGEGEVGSAHVDMLTAEEIDCDTLVADQGFIENLTTDNAFITNLQTNNAYIKNANIEDAAITTAKIGDATITSAKIIDGAIGTAAIADAAITSAKIGTAVIDTANIKVGAITTALLGDAVVGTTQIADGSITDAKIVGLTANKITAGTLDAANITVTNLNADNITTGTINGARIAEGAIDMSNLSQTIKDKLAATGGEKTFFQADAPTAAVSGDLWYDTDDGDKLYHNESGTWVAYQFGQSAISANAITADKLVSGAVTTDKLAAQAVTANKIDVNNLFAQNITATGTISGVTINGGTINGGSVLSSIYTTFNSNSVYERVLLQNGAITCDSRTGSQYGAICPTTFGLAIGPEGISWKYYTSSTTHQDYFRVDKDIFSVYSIPSIELFADRVSVQAAYAPLNLTGQSIDISATEGSYPKIYFNGTWMQDATLSTTATVSANSYKTYTVSWDASMYQPIAIWAIETNHTNVCYMTEWNLSIDKASATFHNSSNSSISLTVKFQIQFATGHTVYQQITI